jgi:hypothetical protein
MDRETVTFLCCALQGVAAALYLGKEAVQWIRARWRGDMKPLTVHHPVWLMGLIGGCLLTAALGFWFVFHPPVTTKAIAAIPTQTSSVPMEQPKTNPLAAPIPAQSKPKSKPTKAPLSPTPLVPSPQNAPIASESTPSPSQQPTYQQKCEGSACAQGPGSQATYNQYGAPKLVMTDAQGKALYSVARPYAGIQVTVFLLNPTTPDSTEYAKSLVSSLVSAGISVPPVAEAIQSGVGSGVSIIRGNNRTKLADDLATALEQAKVLTDFPFPQPPDTIVIFVGPNH